jgi:hypothetical protein
MISILPRANASLAMRQTLARLYLADRFIGWATPTSIATLFAKLAPYGHEG